jgi:3-isopropylmalate dehydrogenase
VDAALDARAFTADLAGPGQALSTAQATEAVLAQLERQPAGLRA